MALKKLVNNGLHAAEERQILHNLIKKSKISDPPRFHIDQLVKAVLQTEVSAKRPLQRFMLEVQRWKEGLEKRLKAPILKEQGELPEEKKLVDPEVTKVIKDYIQLASRILKSPEKVSAWVEQRKSPTDNIDNNDHFDVILDDFLKEFEMVLPNLNEFPERSSYYFIPWIAYISPLVKSLQKLLAGKM